MKTETFNSTAFSAKSEVIYQHNRYRVHGVDWGNETISIEISEGYYEDIPIKELAIVPQPRPEYRKFDDGGE